MAIPYPNQLPLADGSAQTHRRMLENIESIWKSVNASRRGMSEIQEAIAHADEILARGHEAYRYHRR